MNPSSASDPLSPFGFINCDKPIGMTSRDVVNIVAKRFRETRPTLAATTGKYRLKLGHCGTLDPLAEGVLVIGVGPAVRLVPYVQRQLKYYRATFLLGQSSETGDLEGKLVRHDGPLPSLDQLRRASKSLLGTIQQVPPIYSAIKVNGRRAYDRVRSGETFELPAREVFIDRLDVDAIDEETIVVDLVCGSGTYVRSIGVDLAKAVGSVAVMKSLVRYRIGVFGQSNAVTVDQLREDDPRTWLCSPTLGVDGMLRLDVQPDQAKRLANGLSIRDDALAATSDDRLQTEGAAICGGELVAIVNHRNGQWWPHRVFSRDGGTIDR